MGKQTKPVKAGLLSKILQKATEHYKTCKSRIIKLNPTESYIHKITEY